MKSISKCILVLLTLFSISCSSDSSNDSGEAGSVEILYPIHINFDGEDINLRNLEGDNLSNPSGGSYGVNYHLLYGFNDNGINNLNSRIPVQNRKIEAFLVIPKNNISIGEHIFNSTHQTDEYFAKITLKINNVSQVVNTTSGKITVTDVDVLTNIIQGTFEFTTNDGSVQNHVISGNFKYKLVE